MKKIQIKLSLWFSLIICLSTSAQTYQVSFTEVEKTRDLKQVFRDIHQKKRHIYIKDALKLEYLYDKNSRQEFGVYLTKLDQLAKQFSNSDLQNMVYFLKGRYHLSRNNPDQSFENFSYALKGYLQEKDTLGAMYSYQNLTWLFTNNALDEFRQLGKAIDFANRAMDLSRNSKNPLIQFLGYSCLTLVYGHEPVNIKGFKMSIDKKLELIEKYPELQYAKAATLVNLFSFYDLTKNPKRLELSETLKSLPRSAFETDFNYIATQHNLAVNDLYLGNLDAAEKGFQKVVTYQGASKFDPLKADAYEGLREVNFRQGDYKKALEYADSNYNTRDRIYKRQVIESLNQSEVAFKTKEVQQTNAALKKENILIQNRNRIVGAFSIGVVLLLSLLFYLFLQLKKSKQLLEKTYDEIKNLLELKDKYFRIVSHDLRHPFVSYQGLASSIKYLVKKGDFEKIDEISVQIDRMGSRINLILHNLLIWGKHSLLDKVNKKRELSIVDMLARIEPLYNQMASLRGVVIQQNLPNLTPSILGNEDEVETILRNALDNAVKFAGSPGLVEIFGEKSNDHFQLKIHNSIPVEANREHLEFITSYLNTGDAYYDDRLGLGLQLMVQFAQSNQIQLEATFSSQYFTLFFTFMVD